jgi:hypothetical protein
VLGVKNGEVACTTEPGKQDVRVAKGRILARKPVRSDRHHAWDSSSQPRVWQHAATCRRSIGAAVTSMRQGWHAPAWGNVECGRVRFHVTCSGRRHVCMGCRREEPTRHAAWMCTTNVSTVLGRGEG